MNRKPLNRDPLTTPSYPPLRLAWLIWSLASLFYVIGFFHRLAPAVMTQELMRDFDISAAALGNLSGFYFYSYWLMQIPTGILADSWGPRRLLTFGALGSAAGAIPSRFPRAWPGPASAACSSGAAYRSRMW